MTLPAVSSSTIVSSDLFRRQAEAKYGSYMPIRLCTPKVDLVSSSNLRQIIARAPGISAANTNNTAQFEANDLHLRGWSVGVELWMNLDPHAELRLKVVENLELDPSPSSVYSDFMTPGYPQDDLALSVIREFGRRSPHAYDADFNRLNKLGTNIISGLGNVLSTLGIPILSSVAKPISNLIVDKWGYKPSTYSQDAPSLD
nr:capsid protein [Hubei noda-like virus 9]